jgi:hypothetical protein
MFPAKALHQELSPRQELSPHQELSPLLVKAYYCLLHT